MAQKNNSSIPAEEMEKIRNVATNMLSETMEQYGFFTLKTLKEFIDNANEVAPYIEQVIGKGEYKGITAIDVIKNITPTGLIDPDGIEAEIYKKACQLLRAAQAREKQQEAKQSIEPAELQKIIYKPSDKNITITRSDFTNRFFSAIAPFNIVNGQISMLSSFKHNGKKIQMPAVFTQDITYLKRVGLKECEFDNFNDYDFFVVTICDKLLLEGNNIVTPSKMLKELGIPISQKAINDLMKSLYKGKATNTIVNNKSILDAWGIDSKGFKEIDSQIMPVRFSTDKNKVNGNISDTSIEIMALSPFYKIANMVQYVTTWDHRIFTLYKGRRTQKYWSILHYLLREIGWMQANKTDRYPTITMQEVYQYAGDTTAHQKEASRKMVTDLLDSIFLKLDIITGYRETKINGIGITQSIELDVKGYKPLKKIAENITKNKKSK